MAIVRFTGTSARAGDTLTVYLTGTLNLAVLYEDLIGTPLGNPFTSDLLTGDYDFYAEDVVYDIVDDSSGIIPVPPPPEPFARSTEPFLTYADASAHLPNARNLVAGAGITFDDSVANIRTITASAGAGTVTSVGLTVPSFLAVSGSPVTTAGTLGVTLATQAAHAVLVGPTSGGAVAPTFRALVAGDIPDLSATYLTPSSAAALTNKTGNISQWTNDSGYLTSVTAHNVLSATHGDTTASAVARGSLITGQGASAKWVQLVKGTANQVLAMDGTATDILWVTPAATGVTSVGLALPAMFTVSGSPVTTTGTLTAVLATQVTKTFLAGPTSGADATPTFRVIAVADIPSLTSLYEVPLTFSTGLTRTVNTVTVNTSQTIATLSNLTTNGLVTTAGGVGTLGVIVPGTGVLTALAVNVGSAGAFVAFNGALGTPSSGTLTNATGLPEAGLSLTDITTNDVSATKHGFAPKFPNNSTTFLRGDGTYAVPPSGTGTVTSIATTSPISGGTITTTGTISLLVNVDHAFTAGQTITTSATATGALKAFGVTAGLHTNQTLSTEISSVSFTLAGRQWATGAITTQREVLFTQPTYTFVGASTITDAATVAIAGAPIKSTNASITNTHALLIQAGAVSTATNSYGLTVNAQTGATNNLAAKFLGGAVQVGATAPLSADVVIFSGGIARFIPLGNVEVGNDFSLVFTDSGVTYSYASGINSTRAWQATNQAKDMVWCAGYLAKSGATIAGNEQIVIKGNGPQVGIRQTSPTALLHIGAGAAAASSAPFKLTSGTNQTTAEAGAMEYNGTNLFFTRAGTVRENVLVAIDNVAAPSTAVGVGIVNYYGASATNFLGDPNRWLSVNVLGSTYKIPLYT